MNRFVTLLLLLTPVGLSAQITWVNDCSNKNFCFNQGSCSEGQVFLVEKANTACFSSPIINISYRIDLFNDGSTDIVSPEDTVNAPFPVGTHKISWRATDNCTNVSTCAYTFTIKDCLPPSLICIASLTQNVNTDCAVSFGPSDFVINVNDNCTPANELVFGIKKSGTGSGFPMDTVLNFDGCDFGPHSVEIWVKDENNLQNKCFSSVEVQDNEEICGCAINLNFQGCAHTAGGAKLNLYALRAELSSPQPTPPIQKNVTDSCFTGSFPDLTIGQNYQLTVRARRNDNPINGVSTFDLLQTSKHILNVQPFQNAYQRLAADVNGSNSVTTFDVVETRKLILGIYDTFPSVASWRFIRPLADPTNLLSAVKDTYQITLTNLSADTTLKNLDFVGIKMGDTNLSATFTNDDTDDRAAIPLDIEDRLLAAGETLAVPVHLSEAVHLDGWQLAMAADPALARIESVEGLPTEDYAIVHHEARALWFDPAGRRFAANEVLFTLKIKALQPVALSQVLSLAAHKIAPEAYVMSGTVPEQRHSLNLGFGAKGKNGPTFFPPAPNPFSTETSFGFLLRQPGALLLEIFDPAGKRVFEHHTESGAGHASLVLRASDLPAAGVYFYRVRVNGEVFGGRLVRG